MQKIVVLNPKGGSGKSTIATNLASYFAVSGLKPTLMDLDAQGSSMRWLSKRSKEQPLVHGIAGYERNTRVTRSFATRLPLHSERLIVDTAAALESQRLPDIARNATAILVPVLPSDIDIHAAAKSISDLLLVGKIRRDEQRIAVIANRVKKNTLIYKALMRFLETLRIPVVATLRDSQNYIRAAESGIGLFEMRPQAVREDLEQWLPLIGWLAQRRPLHIEPGTPAITSTVISAPPVTGTTGASFLEPKGATACPPPASTVISPPPVTDTTGASFLELKGVTACPPPASTAISPPPVAGSGGTSFLELDGSIQPHSAAPVGAVQATAGTPPAHAGAGETPASAKPVPAFLAGLRPFWRR